MYKTMPDDLYKERLMSRLTAMEETINQHIMRDFDCWVVLKNDKNMVISTLSLDIYTPSKMIDIILFYSYEEGVDSLSIALRRKHAGASTLIGTTHFDIMDICRRYDFQKIIRHQIKQSLVECNHAFYGF